MLISSGLEVITIHDDFASYYELLALAKGCQPPGWQALWRNWPHSSLRNLYKKEFQKLAIHMGVSWGFETPPMWMANHA